jgi:type IV pilus assembly protein PilV
MLARAGGSQRGMSLIEVLVSLVILSLGVLAVVALQLVSTRNNADAGQRTIASQLAYSLLERMRSNSTTASLGNYLTGSSPLGRGSMGATASKPCVTGTTCNSVELSDYDMWSWEQSLDGASAQAAGVNAGGLVQPTACIEGPTGGGPGLYTVTIVWRGTVQLPDNTAVTCGQDPQPSGPDLYSKGTADNTYRRTVSLKVYITTRS